MGGNANHSLTGPDNFGGEGRKKTDAFWACFGPRPSVRAFMCARFCGCGGIYACLCLVHVCACVSKLGGSGFGSEWTRVLYNITHGVCMWATSVCDISTGSDFFFFPNRVGVFSRMRRSWTNKGAIGTDYARIDAYLFVSRF